jgi:hypothetical protein
MQNIVSGAIFVMLSIRWTEVIGLSREHQGLICQIVHWGPSWPRRGIVGPARAPRDSRHRQIRQCKKIKDFNKFCVDRNGRHPFLVELEDKVFLRHMRKLIARCPCVHLAIKNSITTDVKDR